MAAPGAGRPDEIAEPPTGWAAEADAAALVLLPALPDDTAVGGADGHHLQRVRRLRPGECVVGADGHGGWRVYEVVGDEPGRLQLAARTACRREPEQPSPIGVAVALTKGGALDGVVAGLTELGVARIEPVRARRSVVRWDAARADQALDRWRTIAREAAMQCRRARLPEIHPLRRLTDLAGRPGLVVAERSGSGPAGLPPPPAEGFTVVVGPEGGFDPAELAELGDVPRLAVGPHVLRAETAPVAVAASLAAFTFGGAGSLAES